MNTQNSAVSNKRKEKDVTKLMLSDFDVKLVDENSFNEFIVKFDGPQDSPYEGG
jgi:ubiquitin-conjugating enzyme E2 H